MITSEARVVMQIRRGRKVVARVNGRARRGRNRITWKGKVRRKAPKAGRYTVRITGVVGDARTSDQVPLRIKRRRR